MEANTKIKNHKIFVTGATGWIGRTFLHELQSIIGPDEFSRTVYAFASRSNILQSTNYPLNEKINVPVQALSKLNDYSGGQNILLFHSAFLTKDRIQYYGTNRFIELNQYITNTVSTFLESCKESRLISISSGAAANSERKEEKSAITASDPYGYLKLKEERQLSQITDTQVLRIYALTGRYIRDPKTFAIGDLLIKALKKERLTINSEYPVVRSYVSATDVAKWSLRWLLSNDRPNIPIGATSHITTLSALADMIAKLYCLPPPIIKPFIRAPDSYCCSPIIFEKMLRKYGIKPLSLIDQILDTAEGLENIT